MDDAVKHSESALTGRFVVACRDLQAGELVLSSKAFAAAVCNRARGMLCISCLAPGTCPVICEKCGHGFCSLACSESDAIVHAGECEVRRRMRGANFNDYTSTLVALAARAFSLRSIDEEGFNAVSKLCCHRGQAPLQLVADFRAAEKVARRATASLQDQDFVGLMLRFYSNGFSQRDAEGEIAFLLAPEASFFNHSCAPNTCRDSCSGLELRFRALEAVNYGSPLFISYVDLPSDAAEPLAQTEARRKMLQEHYFFHCECILCSGSRTCCKWSKRRLCQRSPMCSRRGFMIPFESSRVCSLCHQPD